MDRHDIFALGILVFIFNGVCLLSVLYLILAKNMALIPCIIVVAQIAVSLWYKKIEREEEDARYDRMIKNKREEIRIWKESLSPQQREGWDALMSIVRQEFHPSAFEKGGRPAWDKRMKKMRKDVRKAQKKEQGEL